MTSEFKLPALKGSPKQIAWAEKIRENSMKELASLLAHGKMTIADLMAMENAPGEAATAQKIVLKDDASWWIDNRNLYIKELAQKV